MFININSISILLIILPFLVSSQDYNWIIYNTDNSDLPNNHVNAITIDKEGNKWIGNYDGLIKFDDTNWTWYNTTNSPLKDNFITSVYIDSDNILWCGSSEGGLAKFDGSNWTIYTTANSDLPSNRVRTPLFDSQGNLWIGTDEGLVQFDGKNKWTIYNRLNSELPDNCIWCIALDKEDKLWIGTDGGLAKFDNVNWEVYTPHNSVLPGFNISALAFEDNGTLWIGTLYEHALVCYNGEDWTVYNNSNASPLLANRVLSICFDYEGYKWFGMADGGGGGLTRFDGYNWIDFTADNSEVPNRLVYSLSLARDSSIWIATYGGGLAKINQMSTSIDINTTKKGKSNYQLCLEYYPMNISHNLFCITFKLSFYDNVTMEIFNNFGRLLETLINSSKNPGFHKLIWNAEKCSPGIYYCRLSTKSMLEIKPLIVIK